MITAPVVRGVAGSFAGSVLYQRHPKLVAQVRAAHPYPPGIAAALDALADEITRDQIDTGESWSALPFLAAECYFYRRLLNAVGYFGPGPWQGVDPFAPAKNAELDDPALDSDLRDLDRLATLDEPARRQALTLASLWGNRADLGFLLSDPDSAARERSAALLVDDSAGMWRLLDERPAGPVTVVADNAARELLPDLILIDHLLAAGLATRVELHIKPYPYFVSDATTADVLATLRRLRNSDGFARRAGDRLWQALTTDRLILIAHPFAVAPMPYAEMPDELAARLAASSLTIMKGDLNYRRLVGDQHWPATTPFAERVGYLPGPVVSLRTLKSDVLVGLDDATLRGLDAEAPDGGWRTTGAHAVIQGSFPA